MKHVTLEEHRDVAPNKCALARTIKDAPRIMVDSDIQQNETEEIL